jgi:hypothetical protein
MVGSGDGPLPDLSPHVAEGVLWGLLPKDMNPIHKVSVLMMY